MYGKKLHFQICFSFYFGFVQMYFDSGLECGLQLFVFSSCCNLQLIVWRVDFIPQFWSRKNPDAASPMVHLPAKYWAELTEQRSANDIKDSFLSVTGHNGSAVFFTAYVFAGCVTTAYPKGDMVWLLICSLAVLLAELWLVRSISVSLHISLEWLCG